MRFHLPLVIASILLGVNTGFTYSQVRLGIVGGADVSNPILDPVRAGQSYDERIGEIGGFAFEVGFTKQVFLYLRPQFVMKGTRLQREFEPDMDIRMGFVEAPFGVKFLLMPSEFSPYLIAGFDVAANVLAESEEEGNIEQFEKDVKDIDVMWNLGGGIQADVARNVSLFFDARYSRGLFNIYEEGEEVSIHTSDILLTAGVLFEI